MVHGRGGDGARRVGRMAAGERVGIGGACPGPDRRSDGHARRRDLGTSRRVGADAAWRTRPIRCSSRPSCSAVWASSCWRSRSCGPAARSRLHHRAVARIVTDLREVPAPGSVEAALARAVGDPELRIAYWLPASGRFVDASGAPVAEPAESPGRSVTTLAREDRRVAVVSHFATLPDLERELGSAVRLGLENERLQAEALAHLAELRASRARIVRDRRCRATPARARSPRRCAAAAPCAVIRHPSRADGGGGGG